MKLAIQTTARSTVAAAPPHFTVFLILGCGRIGAFYMPLALSVVSVFSVLNAFSSPRQDPLACAWGGGVRWSALSPRSFAPDPRWFGLDERWSRADPRWFGPNPRWSAPDQRWCAPDRRSFAANHRSFAALGSVSAAAVGGRKGRN